MTLTQTLESMGYRVREWPMPEAIWIEITDLSNAITAYLPNNATLEQCLKRMKEKREQFERAEQQ